MLWDRAGPRRGALLSSFAFGEDAPGGLEELLTRRGFEHVRFASRLLRLFHFYNSQHRERAAGHGFTRAFFFSQGKKVIE